MVKKKKFRVVKTLGPKIKKVKSEKDEGSVSKSHSDSLESEISEFESEKFSGFLTGRLSTAGSGLSADSLGGEGSSGVRFIRLLPPEWGEKDEGIANPTLASYVGETPGYSSNGYEVSNPETSANGAQFEGDRGVWGGRDPGLESRGDPTQGPGGPAEGASGGRDYEARVEKKKADLF